MDVPLPQIARTIKEAAHQFNDWRRAAINYDSKEKFNSPPFGWTKEARHLLHVCTVDLQRTWLDERCENYFDLRSQNRITLYVVRIIYTPTSASPQDTKTDVHNFLHIRIIILINPVSCIAHLV